MSDRLALEVFSVLVVAIVAAVASSAFMMAIERRLTFPQFVAYVVVDFVVIGLIRWATWVPR